MLHCLIVEDNPLNSMIMKKQVGQLGLDANIVTNGLEALDYCHNNPMPELILLDGYMPKMDGVAFLQQLRQLPSGNRPYVVFCSSSLDVIDVTKALDMGAECHFPKPITSDQITYAMKQAQARRAFHQTAS